LYQKTGGIDSGDVFGNRIANYPGCAAWTTDLSR